MRIHHVPLTSENLPLCEPLWGDRLACSEDQLRRVMESAAFLLDERRALGAIVFEGNRPRAFGLSTFVEEAVMEDFLATPHPQIGKRLLLEATESERGAILDRAQIGRRNLGSGLELVVANTAYDTAAANPDSVMGELMAAFHNTHRGYRIARITNEVFGEAAIGVVTASASFQLRQVFEITTGETRLRSLLGTLTRTQAAAWKTPLMSMFVYNPPRIGFTGAQQELLAAALAGATDEQLSARLGIPLTTVKARWTRIQQRAAKLVPELFEEIPISKADGRRGAQTRHLILQYVRENPAELTPYETSSETGALVREKKPE